jgi:hypothetical protein
MVFRLLVPWGSSHSDNVSNKTQIHRLPNACSTSWSGFMYDLGAEQRGAYDMLV